MKGEWSPNWRLESIPFSAIPDDLLKSWWAKRNGARSGAARIKDDPATEEKRRRQRVYSARNRAKGKSQNTFKEAVEGDY